MEIPLLKFPCTWLIGDCTGLQDLFFDQFKGLCQKGPSFPLLNAPVFLTPWCPMQVLAVIF